MAAAAPRLTKALSTQGFLSRVFLLLPLKERATTYRLFWVNTYPDASPATADAGSCRGP